MYSNLKSSSICSVDLGLIPLMLKLPLTEHLPHTPRVVSHVEGAVVLFVPVKKSECKHAIVHLMKRLACMPLKNENKI